MFHLPSWIPWVALLFFLGFLSGLITSYYLLRFKAVQVRDGAEVLSLYMPIFGLVRTTIRTKFSGFFVDELIEFREKLERFRKLLDIDLMINYAKAYDINYIGLEGDQEDLSWGPGKLACTTPSDIPGKFGYNVFLNPHIDKRRVAEKLSEELGVRIHPTEVQTFLFLHEIGHTPKAGNLCFYRLFVSHALSGGRRSAKRRRDLAKLKAKVEWLADQFALRELLKLRMQRGLPIPC